MPILLAIFGALMSGLVMWMIWGNGMEVVNHYLDARAEKKKREKDTRAAIENRFQSARAPLRAIIDPREAALALLTKLAMLRGEITMEQNLALSGIAEARLQLPGKPEHHTTVAAFAVKAVEGYSAVIDELAPLLLETLTDEEKSDLFAMMEAIAGLHGGPNEGQERMIERCARVLGFKGSPRASAG